MSVAIHDSFLKGAGVGGKFLREKKFKNITRVINSNRGVHVVLSRGQVSFESKDRFGRNHATPSWITNLN